ncbi:YqhG family protein [Bacillus sp. DTU_2020_1000418_1_SI_GHA_SEK_038]|uniref:YqhG family protein n=1 Tax=Bacillus sp. DTU_2020_1000418_1_SI_GHA_SEK_038 TaxID=3077585 RepID=UPI0028EB091B|nr:YqhG family protein [Bacillus sp. DTU_2020_1000418_1_SI_GHA_SEK_038]WNS74211.1 YqhG family protein [Bacillus sp. DTU_2020_1000418_1_SI_GHA_SEK_038]
MQQQEIHKFLERYFHANGCEITENGQGYMTVQLTIDLDKELMNRPFYWHYLEKTGGMPNPMRLTLITNPQQAPEHIKGESIHFGSPRLHQIFQTTKSLAGYIRLYENHHQTPGQQIPLRPWLAMNVRISYECDRKRDVFKSIGLQLINGQMVENFHDRLLQLQLTPKIPDYSFTLSPLIMPRSGISRVENFLKYQIEQEDHSWAIKARERWDKDLNLLEHFYEEAEEKDESYEIEKTALKEQYEPKVKISIVNGGLFYLTDMAV